MCTVIYEHSFHIWWGYGVEKRLICFTSVAITINRFIIFNTNITITYLPPLFLYTINRMIENFSHYNLKIVNIFYNHNEIRTYNDEGLALRIKWIIDSVIMSQRSNMICKSCRVKRGQNVAQTTIMSRQERKC